MVSIVFCDYPDFKDSKPFGMFQKRNKEIRIQKNMSLLLKFVVLRHEVLHCFDHRISEYLYRINQHLGWCYYKVFYRFWMFEEYIGKIITDSVEIKE